MNREEAMKKALYGTTALCAAGMLGAPGAAAESIELGLGGFMNSFVVVGDGDLDSEDDNTGSIGFWRDGEVHFNGSYRHDSGITFGAHVELEVFSDTGDGTIDQIDENYIFLSGDFGRVVVGSENSAAYLMHYTAPETAIAINSGWVSTFMPAVADWGDAGEARTLYTTYLDYGNDENQITYFTPRIEGFQLGISYAPSVTDSQGEEARGGQPADHDTDFHNGVGFGANYQGDLSGVGVAASFGYVRKQSPDRYDSLGAEDYQGINFGLNMSYAGFTFGGSYANIFGGEFSVGEDENGDEALTGSAEGQSFHIGVAYDSGPWRVGGGYLWGESEDSTQNSDDDTSHYATGGVSYTLAPGIQAQTSIVYGRTADEGGAEREGIVGAAGLRFSF